MNEVHIRGQVKTEPWTYSGNLYARLSIRRDTDRPTRAPQDGGGFDYVTVMFPAGGQRGVVLRKGQYLQVHGWLQSRDVHETLADFLKRAGHRQSTTTQATAAEKMPIVHRSITEIVANRWRIE